MVVGPILNYVRQIEQSNPDRQIAVVVSELVERRWLHYLLHNQRAQVLTALLRLRGDDRIVVINVPWYMKSRTVTSSVRNPTYVNVSVPRCRMCIVPGNY